MAAKKKEENESQVERFRQIEVPKEDRRLFLVTLYGITPLLQCKPNEEVLEDMTRKILSPLTKKHARAEKDNQPPPVRRVPTDLERMESVTHRLPDGAPGHPSGAIISMLRSAAKRLRMIDGRNQHTGFPCYVLNRGLLPLTDENNKPKEPLIDKRVAVLTKEGGKKVPMLAVRPIYEPPYFLDFIISLDVDMLPPEKLYSLLQLALSNFGIGSFRVENGGNCGVTGISEFRELTGEEAKAVEPYRHRAGRKVQQRKANRARAK